MGSLELIVPSTCTVFNLTVRREREGLVKFVGCIIEPRGRVYIGVHDLLGVQGKPEYFLV